MGVCVIWVYCDTENKGFSLHGHLGSVSSEDLIGDNDFLSSSPPVLVAPHIAPSQEEGHWDQGETSTSEEGLLADHWEEEESSSRGDESVLEASELILLYPAITLSQVLLGSWRYVRVVDHPVHKLSLLSPCWAVLHGSFLEVCLIWCLVLLWSTSNV